MNIHQLVYDALVWVTLVLLATLVVGTIVGDIIDDRRRARYQRTRPPARPYDHDRFTPVKRR